MIDSNVIRVIVLREVKKFLRERSRLISSIARPVIWLFLVGGGLSRLVPDQGGVSYIQFIYPGIIGMTVLFSSIFSAISIIWDKEFGYMKEILVAPVSRSSIVLGKALSGTMVSMIQVVMILLLSPVLGISLGIYQVMSILVLAFLLSFCMCNIGILIAVFYDSFESFSVIMNFIVMPMFFLSGAMYPVNKLPAVLGWLARINPLTYGIDGIKNVIFPGISGPGVSDFNTGTDVMVILFTSVIFILLSTAFFRNRLK